MSEGIVKWFNYHRGYGFISSDNFKEDVFIHHSEFFDKDVFVKEGSTVLFEAVKGEKGLKAINIMLKEE